MQTATEAEEHLRVIRSLMEKATIYRAISAPTALVGGVCSTLFGGWLYFDWRQLPMGFESAQPEHWFFIGWLGVLGITVAANALFIENAARRRNDPFISPAMRKALWALFPPMLCGAFFTFAPIMMRRPTLCWSLPPFWMVFYGLALLATAQFAPKSIPVLGWFFLAAGLVSFGVDYRLELFRFFGRSDTNQPATANLLMVGTFGLFHLVYAACTWPRRRPTEETSGTP